MGKNSCLIVDDDPLICFLLEKFVSELNFPATRTSTVKKTLELIRSTSYDLVFIDVNLPDGNGLDILEAIRKTDIASHVVVMTAYLSEENRRKSLDARADYFLEKPFGIDELKSVVDRFVGKEAATPGMPMHDMFSSPVSKEAYTVSKYGRWKFGDGDLIDMTPSKARDLIIQCFFEAQKETFAKAKQGLGREVSDPAIYRSITSVVKLACAESEGNFENPSKEDLIRVVHALAMKASLWGTPAGIIEYHKGQVERVLESLI